MAKLFFKYHPSNRSICHILSSKREWDCELSQKQTSCQFFNRYRTHFLLQWQRYQTVKRIALIKNNKTTQEALLFKNLRVHNQKKTLQKMQENTQWQQSLLWLKLFNLRRRQWWRLLLLKKYRQHCYARRKRLKRKMFFLDIRNDSTGYTTVEETHKHQHDFKKTGLFWLKHLRKKTACIIQKRKSYPFFNRSRNACKVAR